MPQINFMNWSILFIFFLSGYYLIHIKLYFFSLV